MEDKNVKLGWHSNKELFDKACEINEEFANFLADLNYQYKVPKLQVDLLFELFIINPDAEKIISKIYK